jgi:hypothetical protein
LTGAAVGQVPGESVAMVFPYADASHSSAMLWQAMADMRFAMPSGYAFVPDSAPGFLDPPPSASYDLNLAVQGGADPSTLDASGVLLDIQRWKVRTVIVGPMPHQAAMVAILTRTLGAPPAVGNDVYVWDQVGTAALRH